MSELTELRDALIQGITAAFDSVASEAAEDSTEAVESDEGTVAPEADSEAVENAGNEPEPERDWEEEYAALHAIASHYMPEGTDIDSAMDNMYTNRNGELVYMPLDPAPKPAMPRRAPARKPTSKAAALGTDLENMSLKQRAAIPFDGEQ